MIDYLIRIAHAIEKNMHMVKFSKIKWSIIFLIAAVMVKSGYSQSLQTTTFPELMGKTMTQQFGFIFLMIGIFYSFLGISFVTHNYINPSIDIIKSRNKLSNNFMNATLLAMTNSAAESFIIVNSILFNVNDIGVYTVVGETAFYALVIQGAFYLVIDPGTKVDWWIITRETVFFLTYAGVFTGLLMGNQIEIWKALVLILCYIVHVGLMVFNYYYEVLIKKTVTRAVEIRDKQNKAIKDIDQFHQNDESKSWRINSDELATVELKIDGKYIVYAPSFGNESKLASTNRKQYREKANPKYLHLYFSENLNRDNDDGIELIPFFQRLVAKCILTIQAYHLQKKVQRSKICKVEISKFIKFYEDEYMPSESESINPEELESFDVGSNNDKVSILSKQKQKVNESGNIGSIGPKNFNGSEIKNEAEKEFDEFENDESDDGADKTIYDMINERVNKRFTLKFPKGRFERIKYILTIPLSYPQYYTIPNPLNEGKQNFYPLTLFWSCAWIFGYTYMIVWFTYEISNAFGISMSIIPLIVYPLGISIRDRKKVQDYQQVKQLFKEKFPEQTISLAETFSGSIFQYTGLMGFTWVISILMNGGNVNFDNPSIQYRCVIDSLKIIIVLNLNKIFKIVANFSCMLITL